MNTPWKSVIGCIVMVVALAGHAAAEGLRTFSASN